VEQARALSGSTKQKYDTTLDQTDTTTESDPYLPQPPERQLTLPPLASSDITTLRKQLHVARAEADDWK
jgi:hypothetical protein